MALDSVDVAAVSGSASSRARGRSATPSPPYPPAHTGAPSVAAADAAASCCAAAIRLLMNSLRRVDQVSTASTCSRGGRRVNAPDLQVPVGRDKDLARARHLEHDGADLARVVDDEVVVVRRGKVVVQVPCGFVHPHASGFAPAEEKQKGENVRTVGRLDPPPLVLPQADLVHHSRRQELVITASLDAHLRVCP